MNNKPSFYLSYICISITIGLLIGISLTYSILKEDFIRSITKRGPLSGDDIRDTLFKNIDPKRIAFLLKKLNQNSNSKDGDIDANTLFVHRLWSELGLNTSFANYSVLTSQQNKDRPNSVIKFSKNGHILLNSSNMSKTQYLGYSLPTDSPLRGTPVYVNFGRIIDFIELSNMNVSVRGHFVIARYSDIPPGHILKLAQERGALGLILFIDTYSDSEDDEKGLNNTTNNLHIDHVLLQSGDPQTPFYPSIESGYRETISESVPQIPALFVSYRDALQIMEGLKGAPTPEKWMVSRNNSNIGPDYEDDSYITLEVNTYLKETTIHNVIGVIKGCIEQDRFVLVGNEGTTVRGTAALIAITESFAKTMKSLEWCPQRTIVFCNWVPHHYSFIGATEWMEENQSLLEKGAVAYLRVTLNIKGNFTFMANSIPILYDTINTVTQTVDNPFQKERANESLKTIYSSALKHRESTIFGDPDYGFDLANSPFLQRLGIPVVEYYYDCDKSTQTYCPPSPLKVFNPMDRDFNLSKTLIEASVETLRILADRPLLPFSDSLLYSYHVLDTYLERLNKNKVFLTFNISLDEFEWTLLKFKAAIKSFSDDIKHLNEQNDLLLRKVNDILMRFEQTFIDSEGQPYAKHLKHLLYGPTFEGTYEGQVFPGLYRLIWIYLQENDESIRMKIIEEFKKHISIIIFQLNSSIHLLKQTFNQNYNKPKAINYQDSNIIVKFLD